MSNNKYVKSQWNKVEGKKQWEKLSNLEKFANKINESLELVGAEKYNLYFNFNNIGELYRLPYNKYMDEFNLYYDKTNDRFYINECNEVMSSKYLNLIRNEDLLKYINEAKNKFALKHKMRKEKELEEEMNNFKSSHDLKRKLNLIKNEPEFSYTGKYCKYIENFSKMPKTFYFKYNNFFIKLNVKKCVLIIDKNYKNIIYDMVDKKIYNIESTEGVSPHLFCEYVKLFVRDEISFTRRSYNQLKSFKNNNPNFPNMEIVDDCIKTKEEHIQYNNNVLKEYSDKLKISLSTLKYLQRKLKLNTKEMENASEQLLHGRVNGRLIKKWSSLTEFSWKKFNSVFKEYMWVGDLTDTQNSMFDAFEILKALGHKDNKKYRIN